MNDTAILYAVGVLLIGGLLYWLGNRNPAKSTAQVIEQVIQAGNLANDLVQTAEQLWLKGELPKDDRFDFVMDELEALFPDLTEQQLRNAIESAVFWMKFGVQKFGELQIEEIDLDETSEKYTPSGLRIREVKHRGPES